MARVTVTQCRKGILLQRIRRTSQTCVEARYQCGMVFECSIRGETSGGNREMSAVFSGYTFYR